MTADMDPGRTDHHPDPTQPLGDLVAGLSETLSRLMRQEVALAKAETKQEVSSAARGVAMVACAGAFALVSLITLSLALARWLNEYVDLGWAYLIVTLAWVLVAAVLTMVGRRQLSEVSPMPERTAETVREIPQAMKGNA